MRFCSGPSRDTFRSGFTLVEVLVLAAVGALLLGLLVPAIGASRDRARAIDCSAREQQLGIAISLYRNDFAGCLPQLPSVSPEPGDPAFTARAFGGKAGTTDPTPPALRPLNRYVVSPGDDSAAAGRGLAFRSPSDRGGLLPSGQPTSSMFDAFGTSYVLNDHRVRARTTSPWSATLVPAEGGATPPLVSPAKTWLLGSRPIYNYDRGSDARMSWYGGNLVRANLLMGDMHVESTVDVPAGAIDTTDRYSFLPSVVP